MATKRESIEQVGKRISRLRKEKSITQPQLGKMLSLHSSTISQIENGAIVPTLPHLLKICEIFGTGLDELVFGSGKSVSLSGFGPYVNDIAEMLDYMKEHKAILHHVLAMFHSQKEKREIQNPLEASNEPKTTNRQIY